MGLPNIVLDSDPQVSITVIIGQTQVPKQMYNLIKDIKILARKVYNIRFPYRKMS